MLYAILCYNDEDLVGSWDKEKDDATMVRLAAVEQKLIGEKKLGPVARLMPTTAATTLRKTQNEPVVFDGPFAETKEQFLGFFIVDVADLDAAIDAARQLAAANPEGGAYEIRPLAIFKPGPSLS